MSLVLSSLLSNLKAIRRLKITINWIQILSFKLHIACVIFHVDLLATYIHSHEPIRGCRYHQLMIFSLTCRNSPVKAFAPRNFAYGPRGTPLLQSPACGYPAAPLRMKLVSLLTKCPKQWSWPFSTMPWCLSTTLISGARSVSLVAADKYGWWSCRNFHVALELAKASVRKSTCTWESS